jgi:hypothetical protein
VRRPPGWLVVLGFLLACGASAGAQTPSPPAAQPKRPPPPLFPKHRRGLYINNDNIEIIDATPQSPPLETDDPGVPDKGEYEINLLTEADFSRSARSIDMLEVDANYGIVLKGFGHDLPTQIKFEFPVVARRENGTPYEMGVGDSAFGLKFNFYNDEHRGLRLSVYPQIEFSTRGSVEKGVAESGQTLILPFLVSHESKYVTIVGNGGGRDRIRPRPPVLQKARGDVRRPQLIFHRFQQRSAAVSERGIYLRSQEGDLVRACRP